MKVNLNKVKLAHKYSLERPIRLGNLKVIREYLTASVMLDSPDFVSGHDIKAKRLLPNTGVLSDRKVIHNSFATPVMKRQHAKCMANIAEELIHVKQYSLVGEKRRSVDIVKDVINAIPIRFISDYVVSPFPCNSNGSSRLTLLV